MNQIIHFHCPHPPFISFKWHSTRNGDDSEDRKRVNQTIQLLWGGQTCLRGSTSLQVTALLPDSLSTAFCYFNFWQQVIHTALKSLLATSDRFLLQLHIKAGGKLTQEKRSSAENQRGGKGKWHSELSDTHCSFKYPSNPGLRHRVPSSWHLRHPRNTGATTMRRAHPCNSKAGDSRKSKKEGTYVYIWLIHFAV